jgi:hypothetical protein
MNTYNIIGYLIYLPVSFYITLYIGKVLYREGVLFLIDSFQGNVELAAICNRFLLIGYYLLNLGYVAVSINFWNKIQSVTQLVEELGLRVGAIATGLAIIHFFNLVIFSLFHKQIQSLYKNH